MMDKNYSKQFEAWVIGLKNNIFLLTRLRLTLLYVSIIASILFMFSVGLYAGIGNNIILFFSGGAAFFLAEKNLKPIQEAFEKQRRFTANASHDLRTPLAVMKIDCEIGLKEKNFSALECKNLI